MAKYREERDSLGSVKVPVDALYGAQTQRAANNFIINPRPMPLRFLCCLAMIKGAAAQANRACDVLEPALADAIAKAAATVRMAPGLENFPVPVFQTGSGTSSNMNMNEVLATLASRILGQAVHPNDHVNASQSSNDVIPTCIQVAAAEGLQEQLLPALENLITATRLRAAELADVTKTGRTHLMDAMPLTLGQELGAWAAQLADCADRLADLMPRLLALPIGGSAVGTGVNVPREFPSAFVDSLNALSGQAFTVAANSFARMAGQDVALECSSCLRALAVVLTKINNDLRWMGSGPLAGLGEIQLEALQPGSSIMPGKVNPVLPEAVLMVCAEVVANDCAVSIAAQSGNFQLNVMLPLIADKLLCCIDNLVGACASSCKTIAGFEVNRDGLQKNLASNPILVTALNRIVGYDAAAAIAKRCYLEQRPVIDIAAEETSLSREELERLLDPKRLTGQSPL